MFNPIAGIYHRLRAFRQHLRNILIKFKNPPTGLVSAQELANQLHGGLDKPDLGFQENPHVPHLFHLQAGTGHCPSSRADALHKMRERLAIEKLPAQLPARGPRLWFLNFLLHVYGKLLRPTVRQQIDFNRATAWLGHDLAEELGQLRASMAEQAVQIATLERQLTSLRRLPHAGTDPSVRAAA